MKNEIEGGGTGLEGISKFAVKLCSLTQETETVYMAP